MVFKNLYDIDTLPYGNADIERKLICQCYTKADQFNYLLTQWKGIQGLMNYSYDDAQIQNSDVPHKISVGDYEQRS